MAETYFNQNKFALPMKQDIVIAEILPHVGYCYDILPITFTSTIPAVKPQMGSFVKAGATAGTYELANKADAANIIGFIIDAEIYMSLAPYNSMNNVTFPVSPNVKVMVRGAATINTACLTFADGIDTASLTAAVTVLKGNGFDVITADKTVPF